MLFEIKTKKNKFIEEVYKKSMKELNDFYGINWVENRPKIFIVQNRKEVIAFLGEKYGQWAFGWISGFNFMYALDYVCVKKERDVYSKKGKRAYSKKEYGMLIKHELSHLFFKIIAKESYFPIWLWEGVAIYTSGQNEFKVRPEKFNQFLSFYKEHKVGKESVYYESGLFIEMLVEKFGKKKFLNFLKSLQKVKNKKEFEALFFKTYKFKLNYKEINKIYQSKLKVRT